MKTILQTGIVATLLLALSCTKETTNSAANTSAQSTATAAQSSDALAQTIDDGKELAVTGEWILCYGWTCNGSYDSSYMKVYPDGTWCNDEGYTGLWVKGRHIFLFLFNNSKTSYSGVICDTKITGIMSTFDYSKPVYQGCFYMKPVTDKNQHTDHVNHIAGTPDASGMRK
jgi:hypothetical protein